jgi:hypothetical protein
MAQRSKALTAGRPVEEKPRHLDQKHPDRSGGRNNGCGILMA